MKTKQSLWISGLSLLLCAALLLGTTFAWFTDSVTSAGNTITAGTLDIKATVQRVDPAAADKPYTITNAATGESVNGGNAFGFGAAQEIASAAPIIDETRWEPGFSNAKLLTVSNEGSLATNVRLEFSVTDDELQNALWFDFVQVENGKATGSFTRREMSGLKALAQQMVFPLKENEAVSFILVYGMKEEADNTYQGKSFEADVTIVATQAAHEQDGFGSDRYDADAPVPVFSSDSLGDALQNAQPGDAVQLGAGSMTLPAGGIPEGVTLAGEDPEKTEVTVPTTRVSDTLTHGLVIEKPGVTIKDVTISPVAGITSNNYAGVLVVKEGGTVLDNVVITSNNSASPVLVTGSGFGVGDIFTISNSTITSNSRSIYIVDGTNGKVVIDNCDITGQYTFNVNSGNSQNLEIEVKDSALHGWTSYSHIKSASFTNTSFSQGGSAYNFMRPYTSTAFGGCTFGDGFLIGAGDTGLTYTFTNCKFADGTVLTAENVKDMLLDPSGDDVKVLDCTVIVDGVKAVLK